MQICQAWQQKMMDQAGLQELGVEAIRHTLKMAPSPVHKRGILLALKKITRMDELRHNMEKEIEQIIAEQRQRARRAHIEIGRILFSGVDIRIGEDTTTVIEDQERVLVRLLEEEGETRLDMEPLRGSSGHGQ